MTDKLEAYRKKRTPNRTPEPFISSSSNREILYFVIQKHAATTLHYDFRLEIDGVMTSWAIPKGPTLDPTAKRLAMQTEDHPMDYRFFEGVIPKGQYGGGPVMIWDSGTYHAQIEKPDQTLETIKGKKEGEKVMMENLKKGELKFTLNGKKVKGSFALIKTKGFPPGKKNAWLLIKHRDKHAREGFDAADYDFSAVSGLNMKQIREG